MSFVALANPWIAVAAALALAFFLFGIFRRLLKLAVIFGIAAVILWIAFFTG